MKMMATLLVSRATAARLVAAGAEHDHSMARQAALIVEAATRLHLAGHRTVAPPAPSEEDVPVSVSMRDEICAVLADIAADRGVTIETQLRAVLDAGVAGYDPPPPSAPPVRRVISHPAAAIVPTAKAIPARKPFDPAYYARHSVAFRP